MTSQRLAIPLAILCGLGLVSDSTTAGEETVSSLRFGFPATGIQVERQAVLLAIDDVYLRL